MLLKVEEGSTAAVPRRDSRRTMRFFLNGLPERVRSSLRITTQRLVGLRHLRLAALLGYWEEAGSAGVRSALVWEALEGPPLRNAARAAVGANADNALGRLAHRAARSLAEAVLALDEAGVCHGWIHPMAVVVHPRRGPVLLAPEVPGDPARLERLPVPDRRLAAATLAPELVDGTDPSKPGDLYSLAATMRLLGTAAAWSDEDSATSVSRAEQSKFAA